jgi:hypothetical protein
MRFMCRLVSCLVLLVPIATAPTGPARAAVTCPFISDLQLTGAMPAAKWSLISNQDGRGCVFQAARGDTLMLTVFRNPTADRARELYATLVKTLGERMPVTPVSGIGDATQAGTTTPDAVCPEASVVALSGEYILSLSVYRSGRPADGTLLRPLTEVARRAIGNVGATSEKFGSCEWLTADDAEGLLDPSTLTIHRTGAGSCLILDGAGNAMTVAVIAASRDTLVNMMNRNSWCKHVPLPEFGRDAFGEHSCNSNNANAVNIVEILVWKNGKLASILFGPNKPHLESGSVEHLKAVASRVYGKM